MNEGIISEICFICFARQADAVRRYTVGQGNYVYRLEVGGEKYIVRCSGEAGAYKDTVHWLKKLAAADIPVPAVLHRGMYQEYEYLILSYLEGADLGTVYPQLSAEDKRMIAKEVVHIQEKAAALDPGPVAPDWTWRSSFVEYTLARARERIIQNGYFDSEKVDRLSDAAELLESYFETIRPTVYLDDISTKNLLIHNGQVSGVIDVDWIGLGDRLTYAALTNMALLNMGYDTDYVQALLEEMQISEISRRVFLFYTLVFCVDFMGERGMRFMDKVIEVNSLIVDRLNKLYDQLWKEWDYSGS